MMTTEQTVLLPREDSHGARPQQLSALTRCLMVILPGTIMVLLWTILYLRSQRATVPDFVDHDFGVAFDLTSPYGTAAISYPNGTNVVVAKIEASSSYKNMISRLSLDSSRHLHPPYDSLDGFFRDQPRQAVRNTRKAAGLPASPDVGELAKLIISLRLAVESHLGGHKISGAVPTIPYLPALYQEDLEDAFEYVGLIYIPHYPYSYGGLFTENGAAYVGNGFGLCSNYTDTVSCEEEKNNPPHQLLHENVLSVSYTREILTSTVGIYGMWFAHPLADEFRIVEPSLGWNKINKNPKEEYYWAAVRDAIIGPFLKANSVWRTRIDRILLYGECSTNEQFQKIMREAVDSTMENRPEIFALDPVYSAVKGAAEMGKRVLWDFNNNNTISTQEVVGGEL